MPKRLFIRILFAAACIFHASTWLAAQTTRLWVLRPEEVIEYDHTTFFEKQRVKVPAGAPASPQNVSINDHGEILFAAPVSLPLPDSDLATMQKVWVWDGHAATSIPRDVARSTSTTGSNLAIAESAPMPFLSADGAHLYWFSSQSRRLQRDGVDLSIKMTWRCWKSDLTGAARQEIASLSLPDCPCTTGACEESCAAVLPWVPDDGVGRFFLVAQIVVGQTQTIYESTTLYQDNANHWAATMLDPPLQHVLDAPNPTAVLEAIPDTGCCGWSNQSNDRTLLRLHGKTLPVFDELTSYKNPDYDVSFYTQNGKLSPDLGSVAMTIAATAKPDLPIQLAEQGQADPEESKRIRKALADLPAVEIKTIESSPRRLAFLPHAALVGWINDKEILIVENHMLVAYNVVTGVRRHSKIPVEDAEHVFLR